MRVFVALSVCETSPGRTYGLDAGQNNANLAKKIFEKITEKIRFGYIKQFTNKNIML